MFTDNENRVNGEVVAAAAQRFAYGRVDFEPECSSPRIAQIAFGFLVHIERNNLHAGPMPSSVDRVAHQKTVGLVLRVRQVSIDSGDDGDSLRHLRQVLQNVESLVAWYAIERCGVS